MPTVLEAARPEPPPAPPRKRWTRAECRLLEDSGLFAGQLYELIEGELISRMGMKRPHAVALTLVMAWLVRVFAPEHIQSQVPIDVAPEDNPASEPQPDYIVLDRPADQIPNSNPAPETIALVIEISDTTYQFDASVKAGLYARAGIADYWVLDVKGRRLLVHRDPVQGLYRSVTAYEADEPVAPLAAQSAFVTASPLVG